jgi:prophage regulatory protein
VQQLTGLSRTALYRLIQANDFPAQVRLAANTVGWLASEVDAWIVARVAASRTRGAPASARKAGA